MRTTKLRIQHERPAEPQPCPQLRAELTSRQSSSIDFEHQVHLEKQHDIQLRVSHRYPE